MTVMRGIFFLVTLTLVAIPTLTTAATIGINYGRLGNDLPSPSDVVQLLQSRAVTNVRIYDAASDVLTAFQNSGIQVSPAISNDLVAGIASSQETSDNWIRDNIQNFASIIDRISVGNEWLAGGGDGNQLLQAMQNVQTSLQNAGLGNSIKVTTPHAFDVNGFPPSQGSFPDANTMRAIFEFLRNTGSAFTLNVYPYFAYTGNSNIDTDYALFNPNNAHVYDQVSGKTYENLFDAQVDTFISAMTGLGYPDLPLVIGEMGWPSAGDSSRGVGIDNAKTYNNNLVQHVLTNVGTPLRPGVNIETYIFALFNENQKPAGIEQNWGLYYSDKTPVYDVNLSV